MNNVGVGHSHSQSLFTACVNYKKQICISQYCTNQSLSRSTHILGMAGIFFSTFWQSGMPALQQARSLRLGFTLQQIEQLLAAPAAGCLLATEYTPFFRSLFIACVDYKKQICTSQYCTNQSLSRHSTHTLRMAAIFFSTFWQSGMPAMQQARSLRLGFTRAMGSWGRRWPPRERWNRNKCLSFGLYSQRRL